ncbi:MAG: ATP-binding protein [Steroidobacteraceae bacterium]
MQFANRQVTALFDFTPAELVGQPVEVLLPERFRRKHVGHRQSFGENLRLRPMGTGQDLYARRRDGTEFPVEISLSPIRDAERVFVAAAIRDVTDRKNAELAIQAARTEADRANMAKSRFLATASHDLRQPLQALALLNGSLRRSGHETTARKEALEQQDQAIGSMTRLLNALLDINKLESGAVTVQRTEFDVATLLQEIQGEFSSFASSKNLDLQVRLEHVGIGTDRSLLAQVLRNLVSNALKYTDKGSVRISCRQVEDAICIEIADSGIGISSQDLPFIFDEFYQIGVSTHATREGYGLGLSIVQRVLRLLALDIAVKSQMGIGSTFSIMAPAADAAATADTPKIARLTAPTSGRQRQVLLVEDDAGVRKAMRLYLKGEGYEVTAAASLAEAVTLATDLEGLELVITDYHLGGGERGTDVITALQARCGSRINAILMTGDTSSAIVELPRDLQLQIISKPVDPDELLRLIRSLLPEAASDTT